MLFEILDKVSKPDKLLTRFDEYWLRVNDYEHSDLQFNYVRYRQNTIGWWVRDSQWLSSSVDLETY